MASPVSVLGESGKSTSESSLSCSFSSSGSDESELEEGRDSQSTALLSPICTSLSRAMNRMMPIVIVTNPKLKNDGTVQTGMYFNSCIGAAL